MTRDRRDATTNGSRSVFGKVGGRARKAFGEGNVVLVGELYVELERLDLELQGGEPAYIYESARPRE